MKIIILLFLILISCHDTDHTRAKEYVVHPETVKKVLYYTGTVQPLSEQTITVPFDAVIKKMHFHYGQKIKKNATIFVLNSPALQKQYNETITEYLKAKDSYNIAKGKFAGVNDLWQSGLISKNNYLSEKSSLNANHLNLMQSGQRLAEMLEQMGSQSFKDLEKLSFENFEQVKDTLTGKHDLIYLRSPISGILLYPPNNNENKKHFKVGSAVKAGDAIAVIANLNGIRIEIEVPEIELTQLKSKMQATVRGTAFANHPLHGYLANINAQAVPNQNALPAFTAVVAIKNLSKEQQKLIKIGMSAAVELTTATNNKLLVPITAVKQKQGQSYVEIKDKNGQIKIREVVTGAAQVDKVIIESGLVANDVVLYE